MPAVQLKITKPKNCDPTVREAIMQLATAVGPSQSPVFAGLNLTGFSGFVRATGGSFSAGALASSDLPSHEHVAADITDLGSQGFLTVETDPVVKAINGIVKSDGSTIAAVTIGNSLSYTGGTLDTIQDIRTTATPQFATIGVGVAASNNASIYSITSTTASLYNAINGTLTGTLGSAGTTGLVGLNFEAQYTPALTASRRCTTLTGAAVKTTITNNSASAYNVDVTKATVFDATLSLVNSSTGGGALAISGAGNYAALFRANSATVTGSVTIPNLYAFYDNGQTVGTANWGIYTKTVNNVIGGVTNGALAIGKTTAPTCALDVIGAILGSTTIEATAGFKCGGTAAVADGTYTVGIGGTTNGTITVKGGIITGVQQAV